MIADAVLRTRLRTHSDRKLWFFMVGCSLILHAGLVVFAATRWGFTYGNSAFVPVYSVDLVSLPPGLAENKHRRGRTGGRAVPVVQDQAIPIQRFRSREQDLTLRKKQRAGIQKSEAEKVKVPEESIAKLKRDSPSPSSAPEKARSGPTPQVTSGKKISLVNIGGMKGEELSQALGLYRALLYERIESNWILPERLIPEKDKLEAVVVVRARRDGTLLDIQFERKSGDSYFDDSVLKAILKSKPLPPFPDIYSPKEEEIVIRFSPANGRS